MKQTPEKNPIWVHLDLMVITTGSMLAFRDEQEAGELASIMGTELIRYTQGKGGTTSATMRGPLMDVSVTAPEDALQGYTKFWFQMYDEDRSLRGELMHAAAILEKALKYAHDRDGRGASQQITLTTRHCLTSDKIPEGQPDERIEEPMARIFYTENLRRLLSTLTWDRDHDLEEDIRQDTGEEERSYNFWSQSVTTAQAAIGQEDLLQILMSTYTVGAMFLLELPLRSTSPGD